MEDIVIDTNVYVHANNPGSPYQAASIGFLELLLTSTTILCVDDKFGYPEAENRSIIGHEFYQHVRAGMLGFAIVAALAANGRLKLISATVRRNVRDKIRRRVPNNPADRQFIGVAYNSTTKVLTSHDYTDMPHDVRDYFRREIEVTIVAASESLGMIQARADAISR